MQTAWTFFAGSHHETIKESENRGQNTKTADAGDVINEGNSKTKASVASEKASTTRLLRERWGQMSRDGLLIEVG